MSVNLEQYKPVTYWVFTTNALRSNIGDGTLEYYKRYESPISSYRKEDAPFSADHPEFFYCNQFTARRNTPQNEIVHQAKTGLGNFAITQHKNHFYNDEVILLLSCDSDGEFNLDVAYYESNTRKWTIEPFTDLADDSDFTEKQKKYVMGKLTDFYNALTDNPKAKIKNLQEEYLT